MILHKYTTFSPYFDRVITHQELFFNRPSLFNDPFDCNYILDTTSNAIEKTDYITRTMQAQGGFTPQDINDAVTKALNNHASFDHLINEAKDRFMARIGVLCFSKTNESPLLWSHYTDKHKGACFVFDTLKDPTFFARTFEIKYRANYPKINFIKDRARFDELVLTKSNDWLYEQEVRTIKDNNGVHAFANKDCLVGVIFGCKTDINEIIRIKALLTANGYNIPTTKASLRQGSYGMGFDNI